MLRKCIVLAAVCFSGLPVWGQYISINPTLERDIAQQLESPDGAVRDKAWDRLFQYAPPAEELFPVLLKMEPLADRLRANLYLIRYHHEQTDIAKKEISAALHSKDEKERALAWSLLQRYPQARLTPMLFDMAQANDEDIRTRASNLLKTYSGTGAAVEIMLYSGEEQRRWALEVLSGVQTREQANSVVAALWEALDDPKLQRRAALLLTKYTPLPNTKVPQDARIRRLLLQSLELEKVTGQEEELLVLIKSRPRQKDLLPYLETLLAKDSVAVQLLAAEALAELQPEHPKLLPLFLANIEAAKELQALAFAGLKNLGPYAKPALERLLKLCSDPKLPSQPAAEALAAIGADAVDPILNLLEEKNWQVTLVSARNLSSALAKIGDAATTKIIERFAKASMNVKQSYTSVLNDAASVPASAVPLLKNQMAFRALAKTPINCQEATDILVAAYRDPKSASVLDVDTLVRRKVQPELLSTIINEFYFPKDGTIRSKIPAETLDLWREIDPKAASAGVKKLIDYTLAKPEERMYLLLGRRCFWPELKPHLPQIAAVIAKTDREFVRRDALVPLLDVPAKELAFAEDDLGGALKSGDMNVAQLLVRMGSEKYADQIAEMVVKRMTFPDGNIMPFPIGTNVVGMQMLKQAKSKKAVPYLNRFARSSNILIKALALEALAASEPERNKEVLDRLEKMRSSVLPREACQAAASIILLAPESFEKQFAFLMQNVEDRARAAAAFEALERLEGLGKPALPRLLALSQDRQNPHRFQAARAAYRIEPGEENGARLLQIYKQDTDFRVLTFFAEVAPAPPNVLRELTALAREYPALHSFVAQIR